MNFDTERRIGDILRERNIEIIGADPVTRHGFTQVPNFILTKKDISVGAKLAYAMLLKYTWYDDACFPGQVKPPRRVATVAAGAREPAAMRFSVWMAAQIGR